MSLEFFSLSGRRVGTLLAAEPLPAGITVRSFDVQRFPAGAYLLRLDAPGAQLTRKVILIH